MDTLDKILKLLNDKNINQKDFTSSLGINEKSVSHWKSGISKSYLKYIREIANYFDVSVGYLLNEESKCLADLDITKVADKLAMHLVKQNNFIDSKQIAEFYLDSYNDIFQVLSRESISFNENSRLLEKNKSFDA